MSLSKLNDIKVYNKKNTLDITLLRKEKIQEKLSEFPWGQLYLDNANKIDNIAYRMYGENVLEDVYNPLETSNTSLLEEELTVNTDIFFRQQTLLLTICGSWKALIFLLSKIMTDTRILLLQETVMKKRNLQRTEQKPRQQRQQEMLLIP